MRVIDFHAAIFAFPVFFRTALSRSGGLTWRRVGCSDMMRFGQTVKGHNYWKSRAQVASICAKGVYV